MKQIRAWSSGGGVQSIAGLVLSAHGKVDFPLHLFCNTGDDSENPDTLDYVRNIAMPYAEKHGIEFVELHHKFKSKKLIAQVGESETLLQRMYRTQKSIPIPIRRSGGAPCSRVCTIDFKVRVVQDYLKSNGATRDNPALCAIGFSLDEWSRLRSNSDCEWELLAFPLFDLKLTRADCAEIIISAGLPIPPKSACWFCPNTSHLEWIKMSVEQPEMFERACELELFLGSKYGEPLYLSKFLVPLADSVSQTYFDVDEIGECSGMCFT